MHNTLHSIETKNKISDALKGRRAWNKGIPMSDEQKQKLKENHVGMLGKHHTKNTKRKISFGNTGKVCSMESRLAMSNSKKGKHHTEETKQKISKSMSVVAKKRFSNPTNHPNWGKHLSSETKRKIRFARLKNISENKFNGRQVIPSYNPIACKIIDEYGKQYGYTFQHAMNGGEFHIKELGYWVDGYDKEKNVVIEYYENHHNKPSKVKKDLIRKQEIINHLDCKFIELMEN
jgi:hypothetical protein